MPFEELINYIERYFILDPDTSSLDLLPHEQAERFKNFKWQYADYPGGPSGRNEGRAFEMIADLSRIRPERRANTGPTAVVTKSKYKAVMRYIESELRSVPDFPPGTGYIQPPDFQLNQYALSEFLVMRAAALRDKVPLIILASGRTAARAHKNAARAGNRYAVAKFSSHMLGLAMDLQMSYSIGADSRTFKEMRTKPMQNAVDMRKSPVHKWMFLRGARYGWYPYQQEPWHWEYNPPGFQARFFSNLKSHHH